MIVLINHGSRSVFMSFIEKALSQEIIIKQYQYIWRRSISIIFLLQISTINQHKITCSRWPIHRVYSWTFTSTSTKNQTPHQVTL
jgi:hypothetical protein